MTLLLENPLPIWAVGLVCTAIACVVFLAKRSLDSLLALIAVLATMLGLLALEKFVVTEREEVEETLTQLLDRIEADDLSGVVAFVDPDAKAVMADANSMMPQVKVRETGSSALRIEVDANSTPHRATTFFRGKVDGIHTRSGARLFFFDKVEIDWVRTAEGWKIADYRVSYQGKPIDAVNSLQSGRATP